MTRTLSDLLQTNEAHLRLQLSQLEHAQGHQNTDIKLSVEVMQAAKQKVHRLGLDQHDTTSRELYHALQERVSADDARLERALQITAATHVSAEANIMDGIVHALKSETKASHVMAMKPAAIKRLLKKNPAKRLVKALGYRSGDAMVRQEPAALLAAAAKHLETRAWRKAWLESYKQLKPADFENRSLQIIHPGTERWQKIANKIVTDQAHTVLSIPEMGAVIVLPLSKQRPSGMVIATMALALHEVNTVTAIANYLRAAEVQADFGSHVKAAASSEVVLRSAHMPQALPWQLLQRYLATTMTLINEDIFGPYVQATDFCWQNVEATLAKICPSLEFWENGSHVTFVSHGQAVSLNIVDAAINACNELNFEMRSLYNAQEALWSELCLRYFNHASIEQAVANLLRPQLAL